MYFFLNGPFHNYNILNTGAHFLGDVASAHVGEKYMYSGKIHHYITLVVSFLKYRFLPFDREICAVP